MANKRGRPTYKPTLCWDCRNATDKDKCPWAGKSIPVPGWVATHNKLKVVGKGGDAVDSYHVTSCPLFDRDSFNGCLDEVVFGKKRKPAKLDDKDIVNIAEAICERAVRDWMLIDYGQLRTVHTDGDSPIDRRALLEFFFSRWFETLLEAFSYHSPDQIRRYLRITNDMRPRKIGGGRKRA